MDDELPLFIYITTQINLKNVLVELNIINDYLQFSKSLDKESKVLTNLFVIFNFLYLIIIYRAQLLLFLM
jgi:hypothetical protein